MPGCAARLQGHDDVCVLAGPRVHRRGLEHVVAGLAELPGVRVASQSGSKALVDEEHRASLGHLPRAPPPAPTPPAPPSTTPVSWSWPAPCTATSRPGSSPTATTARPPVELAVDHARIGRAVYPRRAPGGLAAGPPRARRGGGVPAGVPRSSSPRPATTCRAPTTSRWTRRGSGAGCRAGSRLDDARRRGRHRVLRRARPALPGRVRPARPAGLVVDRLHAAGHARRRARPARPPSRARYRRRLGAAHRAGARDALRPRPDAVVFVLNNDGYTVERAIQSPDAVYQDIIAWNWTEPARRPGRRGRHAV